MEDELWYKDGLRFECLQCGSCCSGFSGTVCVSDAEIAALALRLDIPVAEFLRDYTRIVGGGAISLIEKPNKDCIFFDKDCGCTIYNDRPRQCRTWPFWRSNVHSPDSWKRGAKRCPGMNRGQRYAAVVIQKMSENDGSLGTFS